MSKTIATQSRPLAPSRVLARAWPLLLMAPLFVLVLRPLFARTVQASVLTERASVCIGGAQANGESSGISLSTDGRFAVFTSLASNLVSGDTNGVSDIFLRDRLADQVVRVSVAADGSQADGASRCPRMSGDGTRVVFISEATNLVSGDTNTFADVFVRDLAQGTTTRVSAPTGGGEADGESFDAAISNDGRIVAFASRATNLVPGDSNGEVDVFVRDLTSGVLERVSIGPAGEDVAGSSESPTLSADGRYIAFASTANLLAATLGADTNQSWDVYVRDRSTGTTVRASVSSTGAQGDGHSYSPSISADGSVVAFASYATTLVSDDTNNQVDIFVRSLAAGTTIRVSVGASGQANSDSVHPSISGDGYRIAFDSLATNLDADTAAGKSGVFIHDLTTGVTSRASVGISGVSADTGAGRPAVSLDGHWVAFASSAANLVLLDTNESEDVFLRGPLP